MMDDKDIVKCNLCPRRCNIDRAVNKGFCGSSNEIRIARAALHMWEEPCISGFEGSGAIFFSGCNMKCIFCQNSDISCGGVGKAISVNELADIMLKLQSDGANNINLVTPSHYVNQITEALILAKESGLHIPIVYNTSSYEEVDTIKKLDGLVDVYLPDCKYFDDDLAARYSKAPGYFAIAIKAIDEMLRQTGSCNFDENGMIRKGVIVRHLVLPGHTKDSQNVIKRLLERYGNDIYISVMSQYTPLKEHEYANLNRRLTKREYMKVVDFAIDEGLVNGFMQQMDVAKESFIPPFEI